MLGARVEVYEPAPVDLEAGKKEGLGLSERRKANLRLKRF